MIRRILNYFGYYKMDQLIYWGHCGSCGKPIKGVFLADWNWGRCEECKEEEKGSI